MSERIRAPGITLVSKGFRDHFTNSPLASGETEAAVNSVTWPLLLGECQHFSEKAECPTFSCTKAWRKGTQFWFLWFPSLFNTRTGYEPNDEGLTWDQTSSWKCPNSPYQRSPGLLAWPVWPLSSLLGSFWAVLGWAGGWEEMVWSTEARGFKRSW